MIVFWIIGILFFVVGLLCCVPEYVRLLRYHGRVIGTITKIEDNGQNAIAIFEYDVDIVLVLRRIHGLLEKIL